MGVAIVIFAIFYFGFFSIRYSNEVWWAFNRHKNFPFTWHGKKLWYSRSVAVACYIYCKDAQGNWNVLFNKRGSGCPDYNGCWSTESGYINFNENSVNGC